MKPTLFALALFASTMPTLADPLQLRSDYVWTYNDTCVVSPSGFSAPLTTGTTILYDAAGLNKVGTINGNQWVGKVSKDAKAHTLTTVTPFIQTITLIGPPTIIVYRMCRSNVVGFASSPAD
jgi:hypothetical protein